MELKIEKLLYEGVGLAHFEGKAVFVKGGIEGDIINAKIISKNHNFLRAEIIEIIEPSKYRINPFCKMSNPCGACDLDFCDYEYQILAKEKIVKEIFQKFDNLNFLPIIKSAEITEYRCKTNYPVTETKSSKRIVAGYYKEKSHEIVNIKYCPIQPLIIDEIIQFIRENWQLGCYIEKKHTGLLRHINIRISSNLNEILVVLVLNTNKEEFKKLDLNSLSENLCNKFPQIKGILINLNPSKTNKITGDETILIKGCDFIFEKLGNAIYKIGANSFFQVNPKCAELLFKAAGDLILNNGSILDLYGGIGAIGIFLKDKAHKITLVEENKEAIKFAKENYKLNNISKYEVFEGRAEKIMQDFIKEKRTFANIIIDPPRKGSDLKTLNTISEMTNSIIYISCNPMTLKRDVEILIEKGFKFKSIQPVDMFPNTHHIECVAHFIKG